MVHTVTASIIGSDFAPETPSKTRRRQGDLHIDSGVYGFGVRRRPVERDPSPRTGRRRPTQPIVDDCRRSVAFVNESSWYVYVRRATRRLYGSVREPVRADESIRQSALRSLEQ